MSQQSMRGIVWTGAITVVTVTGALYGAGLKTKQEFHQERRKKLEATPEERIAQLEATRERLVTKKNELDRKIAWIEEKQNTSSVP